MIFRLRRSDIVAPRDSDMKAYGFRDILFVSQTRGANITRRKTNITAIGNITRRKANKTAQLPYGKLGKSVLFFFISCKVPRNSQRIFAQWDRRGGRTARDAIESRRSCALCPRSPRSRRRRGFWPPRGSWAQAYQWPNNDRN